jgi:hypothetical protein
MPLARYLRFLLTAEQVSSNGLGITGFQSVVNVDKAFACIMRIGT